MLQQQWDAVVFDMDGVIFDSERACLACWKEIAGKNHISGIEEAFLLCTGTTDARTRQIMLDTYGEDFPYDDFAAEASRLFHAHYDGGRLPVKKGARELLAWLKDESIPVALASSTRREAVVRELSEAGLLPFFDVLVCGDMVKRSKPDPDIYLRACRELGVEPSRAFAIEDSYNGIRSAHAGGLRPLMVVDLLEADEEMEGLAEVVLHDLVEAQAYLSSRRGKTG